MAEESQKERCIADDQWAIDAFYDGYDKANADFKANGFTGLKPIIGMAYVPCWLRQMAVRSGNLCSRFRRYLIG